MKVLMQFLVMLVLTVNIAKAETLNCKLKLYHDSPTTGLPHVLLKTINLPVLEFKNTGNNKEANILETVKDDQGKRLFWIEVLATKYTPYYLIRGLALALETGQKIKGRSTVVKLKNPDHFNISGDYGDQTLSAEFNDEFGSSIATEITNSALICKIKR